MNRQGTPLEAWLEGDLSPEEEAALRTRAADDPALAAEIAAHDRVRAALGALPLETAPARDLFPAIAARIAAEPPRPRVWPLGIAAALLLLAGLTLMLRLETATRGPAAPPVRAATVPPEVGPATLTIARSAYGDTDRALADIRHQLERTIAERQAGWPPETRAVVAENMRTIEKAIGDIESALAEQPGDADLARTYIAYRERQIDLLRQVNRMAAKL